jgi:hypothetical protein
MTVYHDGRAVYGGYRVRIGVVDRRAPENTENTENRRAGRGRVGAGGRSEIVGRRRVLRRSLSLNRKGKPKPKRRTKPKPNPIK